MAMTVLDRLLFLQGGLCFFCKRPLPRAEASVEHLQAVAHGGTNHDANRVACCRSLNGILGSMPLKDKIDLVLKQDGRFACPNGQARQRPTIAGVPSATSAPASVAPSAQLPGGLPMAAPAAAAMQQVIDNLKRRGTARPRNDKTLRSTLEALCAQQKLGCSVDELLHLLINGGSVTVDATGRVTYRL